MACIRKLFIIPSVCDVALTVGGNTVSSDHVVLANGVTHTSQSGQQKMAAMVSDSSVASCF